MPLLGCHCWVLATNFGGVHVGCHCWVLATNFGGVHVGVHVGCHCWVLATNFGRVHVGCTFLYIDNTKNWLVLSGVYASIIFRFFYSNWNLAGLPKHARATWFAFV